MIRIEQLTRRFHDLVAVDGISLHVQEGEVFGFLGPNGAGKSTTIKILTGFLPASSGKALVGGLDVARESLEVRRRIGYLPENVSLPVDARVDEYLEYRGRLKGIPSKQREGAKQRALDLCGLVPMRRRILNQLSRGYRQRVGFADALLSDPPLLILDEPTGGLDPAQRQEVLSMIGGMAGERTVLLSSHVLNEVEDVCTRVAIIKAGRIVAEGSREELEHSSGRHGEILIETEGSDDALLAWLGERGIRCQRHERGGCLVQLSDDSSDSVALLRELIAAPLPVRRFEPRTRSLQQIYLDLTRS
ncbi:MAG: ABC transporter ATP-binding protein [Planctomycetota bacterium]|nr:ABC transporter ATP-binding protein [Planctomycetota bacterium]